MEKEFIPKDRALKLKELGFNEPCFGFYIGDIIRLTLYTDCGWKNSSITYDTQKEMLTAPLWQQCWDWFIEKHIELLKYNYGYVPHMTLIQNLMIDYSYTYQEAQLACLDKLIKILQQKKQL